MIGAGRMGSGLVERLEDAGHRCVVYDPDPAALAATRGRHVDSYDALFAALPSPARLWLMVPVAVVDVVLDELAGHLRPGDTVIDGGNSHYRDTVTRAAALGARGVDLVDVGTSGGVHGARRGFSLMIGGPEAAVDALDPVFDALAPGLEAAERTVGRDGPVDTAERGYLHCGPAGAGHFVKMVHNGIEYGQMAALSEGMAILAAAGIPGGPGADQQAADNHSETGVFDVPSILEVWRRGSVVSSWLLDLTAAALHRDPGLQDFSGVVQDSGEGRWTVQTAVELGVPAHVLAASLFERFDSRGRASYSNRAQSAMRHAFGGHLESSAPAG